MKQITNATEIPTEGKVILDFYTDSCVGCKQIEPLLKFIEAKYTDITFLKIDCDNCDPQILTDYSIQAIPCIIEVNNTERVSKKSGKLECQEFLQDLHI